MEPVPTASADQLKRLNTLGVVSYVLHLVVAVGALIPGGQWGPLLLVVALILDLVSRESAGGTWHASHIRWRIRSVLFAALAYLITLPLWFLLIVPGWIAWFLVSAWFLYRIIKGMVRMNGGQPMDAPA